MIGVFTDQPLALCARASHDVEVVHVISGRRHRGPVPAMRHQHDITAVDLGHDADRSVPGAINPLVAKGFGRLRRITVGAHLEVVDLLQDALAVLEEIYYFEMRSDG